MPSSCPPTHQCLVSTTKNSSCSIAGVHAWILHPCGRALFAPVMYLHTPLPPGPALHRRLTGQAKPVHTSKYQRYTYVELASKLFESWQHGTVTVLQRFMFMQSDVCGGNHKWQQPRHVPFEPRTTKSKNRDALSPVVQLVVATGSVPDLPCCNAFSSCSSLPP